MPGRRTATTPFSLGHLKQLSNPAWAGVSCTTLQVMNMAILAMLWYFFGCSVSQVQTIGTGETKGDPGTQDIQYII